MKKNFYFLCLSCLFTVITQAQVAPGSVSANLKLWIKANTVTTLDTAGGRFNGWTYVNDGAKSFSSTLTERPTFVDSSVNFNPSARFDSAQLMNGPTGVNAPIAAGDDDYSVFAVWVSPVTSVQRIWSQRSTAAASDGLSLTIAGGNTYGDQTEVYPFYHTIIRPFVLDQWNVSQLNLLNAATNDLEVIDNRNFNAPLSINTDDPAAVTPNGPAIRTLSDVLNRLGARNASTDEPFKGNLAELIVYDAPVSNVTTRNQIFSYLAVKYGIHKTGNYIGWNGTSNFTFWDSTANYPYTNHVFGIGRDIGSGLWQNRSNSMETGAGNGAGSFLSGNIILSAYAPLDNLDYLMIGADNGALAETPSDNPQAFSSPRLAREWKVQETGIVGSVNLSFDLNGIFITGLTGNKRDFRIMIDEDGDGNFNTGTVTLIIPDTVINSRLMFTNLGLNNGVVFTFLTHALAGLPVKWKSVAAIAKGNSVEIKWSVTNNEKGDNYEIEHSTDGSHFTKVGEVKNNVSVENYSYTHQGVAAGKHYYRITQKDLDGKIIYSEIKVVTISAVQYIKILNNPVRGNFVDLDINTFSRSDATIQVWSVNGSQLSSLQTRVLAGSNRVKVPLVSHAAGVFVVKVIIAGEPFNFNIIRL